MPLPQVEAQLHGPEVGREDVKSSTDRGVNDAQSTGGLASGDLSKRGVPQIKDVENIMNLGDDLSPTIVTSPPPPPSLF